MTQERRTLQQLDGKNWGEPEAAETPMIARCLRLRRIPFNELSPGDLRLLISQKISLQHTIPEAIMLLSENLLIKTEYFPGDLLAAVLAVGGDHWAKNPTELAWLKSVMQPGIDRLQTIIGQWEEFLAANP